MVCGRRVTGDPHPISHRPHALTPFSGPDKKQITSVPGFLAPATESSITYDADGNLTADGRWTYTWDAENRLTSMQTTSAAITAGLPGKKLEFRYDSTGRRTSKKVSTWSGSAWTVASEVRFVYQGWNLVAELDTSGTLIRTYAWGLDLAGSLTATGGIGALVQFVDNTGTATAYHPGYDGSGNVAAIMKDDGTIVAAYEYGPFGELLRKDGTYAADNPFRNATKYTDNESGYVYYGTRFYSPSQGRFINRDTIGEQGGLNLYAFCANNGVNNFDVLGRDAFMIVTGMNGDGSPHWVEGDGMTGDDYARQAVASANSSANDMMMQQMFAIYDSQMKWDLNANGFSTSEFVAGRQWDNTPTSYFNYQIGVDTTLRARLPGAQSAIDAHTYAEFSNLVSAPNSSGAASSGSSLGNALRNIPLLGGLLGGVGDILSGTGNVALGVATFGQSGTLARGFSEIGSGLGGVAMGALDLVGKAWASPVTALGIVWGLAGVPFGASISFGHNAIQFINHPFMADGAITFGNTISYSPGFGPDRFNSYYGRNTQVGIHEEGHTYQYELLGALFPLFYLPRGLAGTTNPMEQAADDYASGGGWLSLPHRTPVFGSGDP